MTPPTPLVYPAVMCVPDSGESGGMQSSKGEDAGPVLTETWTEDKWSCQPATP